MTSALERLEDAIAPMLKLSPVAVRVSLSLHLELPARMILGLLVTVDPYLHADEFALIFKI
jgi:hypothetical protein